MTQCGFVSLDGSPGFFYHPQYGAEVVVYVDDFILIAPPHLEAQIWGELDKVITFKDPGRRREIPWHLSQDCCPSRWHDPNDH